MEDAETRFAPGFSVSMLILVSTLFLGGIILVIGYIVSRLSGSSRASDPPKNDGDSEKVKFEDRRESTSGSAGTATTVAGGTSSNKRAKNKKRREAQQEFTHSWMVGALKGHTAPVLDMSFSSNGKFLASCAEDCVRRPKENFLDPGQTAQQCKASSRETPSSMKSSQSLSPSPESKSESAGSSTASSTASGSSDTSSGGSTSSTKEDRAILSRRQRKNRTRTPRDQRQERDDEQEDEQPSQQNQQQLRRHHHCPQEHYPNGSARSSESSQGSSTSPRSSAATKSQNKQGSRHEDQKYSSQRQELHHLSDASLANLLRNRYILTGEEMAHFGYPFECHYYPGSAIILNHPVRFPSQGYHNLDANAREFVPGNGSTVESEADSGTYSGSSVESSDLEQESASDSDKSSDIGESSSSLSTDSSSSSSSSSSYSSSSYQCQERFRRDWTNLHSYELVVGERRCARCHKNFYVNKKNGEYLKEERCFYHWGKYRGGVFDGFNSNTWECCKGRHSSRGCTIGAMHVWTGLGPGYNGPFNDYVHTLPAMIGMGNGNYGVYGLDCEMCFTRQGLELAKVTVVNMDGEVVYDTLVRPDVEIIDYNTRFSGITAEDMSTASKSLRDVQQDLTRFVFAQTILIGHALNNDLRALKLVHTTVIDTCVTFPHFLGYPFRSSLKTLARAVLRREIQTTEHDSVEDARIVIDLILRKLRHDVT